MEQNNLRYAMLTDEHLKELIKLRLSNDRYEGRITDIIITEKKNGNKPNEPFSVRYEVKTVQYGSEEIGILFKRFSIDEWDYIHRCLEELNVLPVSQFVLSKNGQITDLELSNRGYLSSMKSVKEALQKVHDQIKV